MITHAQDGEIDELLDDVVVDARLKVTSWLGAQRLATLTPEAGTISWNGTDRRGLLDVDVAVDQRIMTPTHPLANVGQVLEASWEWPDINVEIPCGRWLISEPATIEGPLWQVSADPEGPARLARAQLWEPGEHVIQGSLVGQIRRMFVYADVPGDPEGAWVDRTVPTTEVAAGTSVLTVIDDLLAQAGSGMRPSRHRQGVVLYANATTGARRWHWSTESRRVISIKGAITTEEIPNRVTVWCEEDVEPTVEGGETTHVTRGFSMPLYGGPRRWGGPYGQVPKVVRLDAPVPDIDLRNRARYLLREAQERAATVRVEMRADPRVEVGDLMRATDAENNTDCYGRVTSVELDAGTGTAVVQCSVTSGRLAGEPISILNQ